jgi:protein tyrosine phosphatase
MPDTVTDFWRMMWDNNVKVVLMACNEYEGIPRKV